MTEDDLLGIARAFKDAGCDLISMSSGQTVADQAPVYGRMYQVPFSEAVRNVVDIKTMCVGAITEPGQVNTIIACRRADLVALGRPHLTDPNFALRAAAWYGVPAVAVPKPYLPGAAQLMRETAKQRDKQLELQKKAGPTGHAGGPRMTIQTLLPPGWPKPKGYANGIAASGRIVVTAGVVGWDSEGRFPPGMAAQCAQTFENIAAILAQGGAKPADVVKLTWYVTSRTAYLADAKAIGAAYRAVFGAHYPAMAVVEVVSLMEADALVEIEAMAVIC